MNTNAHESTEDVRDLRIDFFRGLALIIVLIDHVEMANRIECVNEWTLRSLGFSDAAEGFVFLSGYTFGMVYGRRLDRNGFLATLRKACLRSVQIYGAYLLALVAVLSFGWMLQSTSSLFGFWLPLDDPISTQLVSGLLLSNHPIGFSILTMYVVILPFAPGLLWLLRRNVGTAIVGCVITATVYGLAVWNPAINVPRYGSEQAWHFNPFAWQFVFFVGMFCRLNLPRRSIDWLAIIVGIVAIVLLVAGVIESKLPDTWIAGVFNEVVSRWPFLVRKSAVGPLRVVHFLAVAWLCSMTVGKHSRMFTSVATRWIVNYGQHSLFFYSLGLVLTFVSIPVFAFAGGSPAIVMIVHADLILLSIAIHVAVRWGMRLSVT